jgi:hypothetical protein
MLYPMVQSVALIFVEKVKKMPSQWHIVHCHHHHPKNKISFSLQNYLNFEYVTHAYQENTSAFHCWRSQQPSVPTGGLTGTVQAHRVNIHIHS